MRSHENEPISNLSGFGKTLIINGQDSQSLRDKRYEPVEFKSDGHWSKCLKVIDSSVLRIRYKFARQPSQRLGCSITNPWQLYFKRNRGLYLMVVWLIGLSAAGKTTIGKQLYDTLKPSHPNLVFIDGDDIRKVFGNDLGHTMEDRLKNAERICRLCKYFASQGIHVVCSILSLFPESREWNRNNIPDYFEVYIKAPMAALENREFKGLYRDFEQGKITGVVGKDIPFAEPNQPDLVLDNSQARTDFAPLVDEIRQAIQKTGILEVA